MKQKAFTLIELLVVVAIIGILAAVGVVAYNGYTASAKKSVVRKNHKMMVNEFKALVIKFEIDGYIYRNSFDGKKQKKYTQRNLAFDCSPFSQHWQSKIKTPYADATAKQKKLDAQSWGGVCTSGGCWPGKEGRTFTWFVPNKAKCSFTTYLPDNEIIYEEVDWPSQ